MTAGISATEIMAFVLAIAASATVMWFICSRPSGKAGAAKVAEELALQAVRNDMNMLRLATESSLQNLTGIFSSQLQGVSGSVQSGLASMTSEVNTRLESMNSHVAAQLANNIKVMADSSQAVTRNMMTVQNTFAGLQKQVGEMTEQARQLGEMSKSLSSLERVLASPKLRGNFGEAQLEALLGNVFPADQFQMQYCFPSGDIADAILFFPQGKVVVDSKFPLENFRRMSEAGENDKKGLRKEFIKDVRRRIDEIAARYVRPGDGTFPFALMFIPAENVYYEAIIRDDDGNDLYAYCEKHRVFPVSPNTLYAYLQTIVMGMRGMRISARAESILREIESLHTEMVRFTDCYDTVGKHLRNASAKFDDSSRVLQKVEQRLEGLSSSNPEQDILLDAQPFMSGGAPLV